MTDQRACRSATPLPGAQVFTALPNGGRLIGCRPAGSREIYTCDERLIAPVRRPFHRTHDVSWRCRSTRRCHTHSSSAPGSQWPRCGGLRQGDPAHPLDTLLGDVALDQRHDVLRQQDVSAADLRCGQGTTFDMVYHGIGVDLHQVGSAVQVNGLAREASRILPSAARSDHVPCPGRHAVPALHASAPVP